MFIHLSNSRRSRPNSNCSDHDLEIVEYNNYLGLLLTEHLNSAAWSNSRQFRQLQACSFLHGEPDNCLVST